MYIDDQDQLKKYCEGLAGAPFITVDTEFMRERTYYPRLCLIQVSTDEDNTAIIDPFEIDDLGPLLQVMADKSIVKVFHAGVQDLEIFHLMNGAVPRPVFDTQIAATLAGFPQQVGYGALVQEMLGVELDKSDTFTDWSKRPLSATQIEYARNDVRYLPKLYLQLKDRLEAEGRLAWLRPDFEKLEDPSSYEIVPEETWRRLKKVSSLNRRQLGVAVKVAAWREREARRRDIPRRWVLGDDGALEVARRAPNDADSLRALRGVGDKVGRRSVEGLLAAVREGVEMPDDEIPRFEKKKRLNSNGEGVVDLMASLVRIRAKENNVAVPLLASRKELERLAGGERDGNPMLEGWRRAIVGDELLAMLEGGIAMRIVSGQVMVEPVQQDKE